MTTEDTATRDPVIVPALVDIWRSRVDLPVPPSPEFDQAESLRSMKVVNEECMELDKAVLTSDLPAIAHEGIDLIFSTLSLLRGLGIPVADVWREVVLANMRKGTVKDENGKVLKGPDYVAPDVAQVLRDAGWGDGEDS